MNCFSEEPSRAQEILPKKARNKHEELIKKIAVPKDGYIETYLVNETSDDEWIRNRLVIRSESLESAGIVDKPKDFLYSYARNPATSGKYSGLKVLVS